MKSIWNTLYILDIFLHHSFSCDQQVKITEQAREKILNLRNTYKKKCWTHQIPTSKNFKPTKYHEKTFWNHDIPTRKKIWTYKIPTRKNFGPTKYPWGKIFEPKKYPREKFFNPRNTHKKKIWTQKIPTRKNFGPMKYPRQKILNSRNTQEGTMVRWHQIHDTQIARDSPNLVGMDNSWTLILQIIIFLYNKTL